MKRQLLLYLFILSLLMNVFTFMYYSKKDNAVQKKIETQSLKMKDSTLVMYNTLVDANYFSLEQNDNARNYFENYNINELSAKVKDALMDYNDIHKGNKYIDQPKFGKNHFTLNKVKLLNHRWIIADYSDGEYWGEVLIKYFVNEDQTVDFETVESYVYPKEKME